MKKQMLCLVFFLLVCSMVHAQNSVPAEDLEAPMEEESEELINDEGYSNEDAEYYGSEDLSENAVDDYSDEMLNEMDAEPMDEPIEAGNQAAP